MAIVPRHIDWGAGLAFGPGQNGASGGDKNLDLNTEKGTKPIRLNSRNTTETSGNLIGVQCKPGASGGAGATADIKGMEIQPRFNGLTSGGNLIGLDVSPILKGTTGADGNLSGVVVGIDVNFTDDNAGVRTITGKSAGIRFFRQLTTKTFTNGVFPIVVATTGAGAWTSLMDLPSGGTGVANVTDAGENLPSGVTEWIYVHVGGTRYRIALYHETN
jgi:hypothetical protein